MDLLDFDVIVDDVVRNARRRRWLLDPANTQHPAWDVIMDSESTPEQIDAAIDEALRGR